MDALRFKSFYFSNFFYSFFFFRVAGMTPSWFCLCILYGSLRTSKIMEAGMLSLLYYLLKINLVTRTLLIIHRTRPLVDRLQPARRFSHSHPTLEDTPRNNEENCDGSVTLWAQVRLRLYVCLHKTISNAPIRLSLSA